MALRQRRTLRVPHLKSLPERMKQAADILGIVTRQFGLIETNFQAMARRQISAEQLERYLHLVFPDPQDEEDEKAAAKARSSRLWSTYFFERGKGMDLPGVKGSLWAAYNGVAELTDHRQPGGNSANERQLESAWFGDGYSAKARAYRTACEMVKR